MRCLALNVRMNCSNFPLVLPYAPGLPQDTNIGYDAIACVQRAESWVIEARNSSRGIALTSVLGKWSQVDAFREPRSRKESSIQSDKVQRSLSSSNKVLTHYFAYTMSTYNWLMVRFISRIWSYAVTNIVRF